MIREGEEAPDFTLAAGEKEKVSAFPGQHVGYAGAMLQALRTL